MKHDETMQRCHRIRLNKGDLIELVSRLFPGAKNGDVTISVPGGDAMAPDEEYHLNDGAVQVRVEWIERELPAEVPHLHLHDPTADIDAFGGVTFEVFLRYRVH